MKTKLFIGCSWLVLATACEVIFDNDSRYLPVRNPAALVLKNRLVSYTSSELVYETDVLLLEIYDGWYNTFLDKEAFVFGGDAKTTVLDFQRITSGSTGASSSLLLMDVSGSYEQTDPYNARSQAINKFFHDHSPPDNFLLGAFSKDGSLTTDAVEFYGDNFTTKTTTEYSRYLFELASRTGGSSSLYDALEESIAIFSKITNARKELVVLVHAPDAGSSATSSAVLQKSQTEGVRMHMIALGNQAPVQTLATLAHGSGGFFAACRDEKEMVCVFNQLHRLLNGDVEAYRIRVKVEFQEALVTSNWEWMQTISITDTQFGYEYNPAYAYIKIP